MVKTVIKSDGTVENFDAKKLEKSLIDSGVPEEAAQEILVRVIERLDVETTTKKIWRTTLSLLSEHKLAASARYSLRRAVSALGPTGFPFEQYVAAILRSYGFETKTNQLVRGVSGIEHEIDIVAEHNNLIVFVEAKFHKEYGYKTHLDVAMYAHARREDIFKEMEKKGLIKPGVQYEMWLVTNTKFTSHAIKYSEYSGVRLIGWSYPEAAGLEEMIVEECMYPVTVLPSLSMFELEKLVSHNIVLAKDLSLIEERKLSQDFGIPPEIAKRLKEEATDLVCIDKNVLTKYYESQHEK